MEDPNTKLNNDTYSKEDADARRDEALRKALSTPPKPHDSNKKSKESQSK